MQYKCDKCNDSGSLNKFGPYYDCTSCDAAEQRVALEKFRDELREKGEGFDDIAFAIHQRALAMAQKQEDTHINDVVKMVAPEGWKLVPEDPTGDMFRAAAKIDNEMFAGGSSHGAEDGQVWAAMYDAAPEAPVAAPAAANSALTDEQINEVWESLPGLKIVAGRPIDHWNSLLRHEFARAILATAGPDAALVKVLEEVLEWYMVHGELHHTTILCNARAALSGAKGN